MDQCRKRKRDWMGGKLKGWEDWQIKAVRLAVKELGYAIHKNQDDIENQRSHAGLEGYDFFHLNHPSWLRHDQDELQRVILAAGKEEAARYPGWGEATKKKFWAALHTHPGAGELVTDLRARNRETRIERDNEEMARRLQDLTKAREADMARDLAKDNQRLYPVGGTREIRARAERLKGLIKAKEADATRAARALAKTNRESKPATRGSNISMGLRKQAEAERLEVSEGLRSRADLEAIMRRTSLGSVPEASGPWGGPVEPTGRPIVPRIGLTLTTKGAWETHAIPVNNSKSPQVPWRPMSADTPWRPMSTEPYGPYTNRPVQRGQSCTITSEAPVAVMLNPKVAVVGPTIPGTAGTTEEDSLPTGPSSPTSFEIEGTPVTGSPTESLASTAVSSPASMGAWGRPRPKVVSYWTDQEAGTTSGGRGSGASSGRSSPIPEPAGPNSWVREPRAQDPGPGALQDKGPAIKKKATRLSKASIAKEKRLRWQKRKRRPLTKKRGRKRQRSRRKDPEP